MARPSRESSIDSIIRDTADQVVSRVSQAIARHVGDLVQEGIRRELGRNTVATRRPARRGEMTRWVADNRARRVPNFVIHATGLDTKKKIVAKFGVNAAFELGKPLPTIKANAAQASEPAAKAPARAKPPVVRKKTAAAAR